MDRNLRVLATNCTEQHSFFEWFSNSPSRELLRRHFAESTNPVVIADGTGLSWMAASEGESVGESKEESDGESAGGVVHLLGPVFTVEAPDAVFQKTRGELGLYAPIRSVMAEELWLVPTVSIMQAKRFSILLHFCATGQSLERADVVYSTGANSSREEDSEWASTDWHGTWDAEREMVRCIKNGDLKGFSRNSARFASGRVGSLCPGDPLRQAKDEALVLVVLASRAAMSGGVSPEGGYNLSDYYIQRIEACEDIASLHDCQWEIALAFIRRVQLCKMDSAYTPVVAKTRDYIRTHIYEKINLDDMAKELGYAGYYLSRKFREETGESLNTYIKGQKIELAKELLRGMPLSIAEVSERLCFSSHSYFSATFREIIGCTPAEYQAQARNGNSAPVLKECPAP